MAEILRGIDPERIAPLLARERFFWIDVSLQVTSRQELGSALGIPDHALTRLLDFREETRRMGKFHADGEHVVFTFGCFVDLDPIEVHVLVSGDYVLTVHDEPLALPDVLDVELPEGRSEQFLIYAVLEAMLVTGFNALTTIEDEIEELQSASTDLRSARGRIDELRGINTRLVELRRRVAPGRGTFARIADEIGHVKGLEEDSEDYFDRIAGQINRLVDSIDAATDAVARLIDLRVNETIYWLTVVATVFLPLTFITGFFGMNFAWMVKQITSPATFFVLGVGGCVLGVAITLIVIWRRGTT